MESDGQINCVSCGCTLVGGSGQLVCIWGHSHNLPVKHFPQFEADPKNFKPRCNNCHDVLDYPDFEKIIKFDDFSQLMAYRLEKNIHEYNRWVSALIAIGYTDYSYAEEK